MSVTVHYSFTLPIAISESKRLPDVQSIKQSIQEIDLALKTVDDSKVSVSDFTQQIVTKVSNVDFTTGLMGKADALHTHSIVNVTGLQTALDSKPTLDANGKLTSTNLPEYIIYSELKYVVVTNGNYNVLPADSGSMIVHPSTDAAARTIAIPAGLRPGTCLTFINENGAGTITITCADTVRLAGAGTTGSRTLTANGSATYIKLPSGAWIASGTNLT